MDYYVVTIDYGRRGREAVVDPETTRREIVDRIRKGEWKAPIAFIHHVEIDENGHGSVSDVTNELLKEAGFYERDDELDRVLDRVAIAMDHRRDQLKHEVA